MKINKSLRFVMIALFVIVIMSSFVLAYYRSQTNYVQYGPYDRTGIFGDYTTDQCQAGQDFILQVNPLGCEPALIRSDLLEEQNVPVFCPISATKMNPLIDVEAINSISITGDYPKEVATVGFHPAEAALNPYQNEVNQPVVLDNIGYAVIVLKKQGNESAMPDYVEGNLTARIRYDVQNAFGVGQSVYYLPVLDDEAWLEDYKQYSFWDGRGYLRADGVYNDEATISIYSDEYRQGVLGQGDNKRLYSTVTLNPGEISDELYIPGFDSCLATMRIKLDGVENPDRRASFRVDGNPVEVAANEKFLDGDCKVLDMNKEGITSSVELRCNEDREGIHKGAFTLNIVPNITLEIDGVERSVKIGDYLYENGDNKKVYLGYAGTVGDSAQEKDLYAYLMSIPNDNKEKDFSSLSINEIDIAKKMAERLIVETTDDSSIGTKTKELFDLYIGLQSTKWKWLKDGETFRELRYGQGIFKKFGKDAKITGFSGAHDVQLSSDVKGEFEKAKQDYNEIIQNYPDETYTGKKDLSLAENSLYNLIDLADRLNQKKTMLDLCDEFKTNYPDSDLSLKICNNGLKGASSSVDSTDVLINGNAHSISFEGVYEPSDYEYSANVRVVFPEDSQTSSRTFTLTKNEPVYLNYDKGEYIMLTDLDDGSATLDTNIRRKSAIGNEFERKQATLALNIPQSFSSGYSLTLEKVNLKKVAKVSIIPNIDYAQTTADFNFRVNIDKRDLKLAPEKTQEKINQLDKSISKWKDISNGLNTFVKDMNYACLATSSYLTVKNYVNNVGGKGIARNAVMNSQDGWYDKCDKLVREGAADSDGSPYKNQEDCLFDNADAIDKNVDEMNKFLSDQQNDIQKIQDKNIVAEGKLFSSSVINSSGVAKEFSVSVRDNLGKLGDNFADPNGKGEIIDVNSIKNVLTKQGFDDGKYDLEQLRDIDLNARILNSNADENVKAVARQNLYNVFSDVKVGSDEESTKYSLLSEFSQQANLKNVGVTIGKETNAKVGVYDGGETTGIFGSIPLGVPVQGFAYGTKRYLLELENVDNVNYVIKDVYSNEGVLVTDEIEIEKLTDAVGSFKKYDDASYNNKYNNPQVKYYETEPYKGYPAIVPFDLDNGWYVAVRQTVSIFGGVSAYDDSGKVSSFFLCNVGENGNEENMKGDDVCRSVNSLQQNVDQFSGISDKGKVNALLREASDAVYEAQRQHSSGIDHITINGKRIPVGSPAVDVPEMKCEDLMSPKDCNTLFNFCDPVVCPSSRCNLGGNYYVQDVTQSGIIGSIALCLPNAQEGIYVPVCLTGLKAGLDGLLSVFGSYKGCLQESLNTGQTTGVCDEVQSIYMCEYFYRQAVPIAKFGIPKLTELLTGKGSRGGGEYLTTEDAWNRAQTSLDYFANYYARNSYEAFKARSVEDAGQEIVCNNFLSVTYPGEGGLLDAITTPASPVQYYGRFETIPYTTATNPPQSQYKVYYHIYAGEDRGSYYNVYLKGDSGSSFYQDTSQRVVVATGYIGVGQSADETKDFLAPTGYKELCININGYEEECGFGEVTTNFLANYVAQTYVAKQANQTDIKTESACISGTASLYGVANPNLQLGGETSLSPSIYNEGITRICATRNPGEGTDPNAGKQGSRWVEVGYCGDENLKCWLDTQSVENSIDFNNIESGVINNTAQNYQDVLASEGKDLTDDQFSSTLQEIENQKSNPSEVVKLVNSVIDIVLYNNQVASLLYLRGNAYKTNAINNYAEENTFVLKENVCDSAEKEKCDGTKIMRCSTSGEWTFFLDCATTGDFCTTKSGKGECISSVEATKDIQDLQQPTATDSGQTLTPDEQLLQDFNSQASKLGESGWKSWTDVDRESSLVGFDAAEQSVIRNSQSCSDCGKGFFNGCEVEECIAIGFRLRDQLNANKVCAFEEEGFLGSLSSNKCQEVTLPKETTNNDNTPANIPIIFTNAYNNLGNLFQKYAVQNLPDGMTELEFQSLLVAVSERETGVGAAGNTCGLSSNEDCNDWLMGYTDGSKYPEKYKGKETQISKASSLLKNNLENPSNTYASCGGLTEDAKLKCVLAVYQGGASDPNYNYADDVISFSQQWESYLG